MASKRTSFTTHRGLLLATVIALLLASCSAPQPTHTPAQAQVTPTAGVTRTHRGPATRSPAEITTGGVTYAMPATTASQATATPTPLYPGLAARAGSTPLPSPSATALTPSSVVAAGAPSSLVPTYEIPVQAPSLNPNKYPAPVLLTPQDGAVYHDAQPIVHFTWTNTSDKLLLFGEEPQCTSDATHFRHTFETNQLVIHSLDGKQPDRVQWQDAGTEYYLNLTTVPAGRYSWWVNIGVVCESYVVGQRDGTPWQKSTLERTYLGQVSPNSPARMFTWTP